VAIGGEVSYAGPRCDYLRAGGQLRLGVNDTARVSAEQWASVCVPVITMEFGHHLEWDVRPSLLAPLGQRAGLNRRETLRFHWQPLRGPLPRVLAAVERAEAAKQGLPQPRARTAAEEARLPQGELIIFDIDVQHTILWDASTMAPATWLERVEAVPFRYAHDRFTLDIGAGGGEFNDAGSLVHAWAVKLEDLGVGPIEVTAGIGIASGSAGPFVEQYTREVDVTSPRAVVGLALPGERVAASLRATRDVALAPDGYVTLDSRLAAALAVTSATTRVTLDATLGRTEVHVPGMPAALARPPAAARWPSRTGCRRASPPARFELARSFYAADVLVQAAALGVTGSLSPRRRSPGERGPRHRGPRPASARPATAARCGRPGASAASRGSGSAVVHRHDRARGQRGRRWRRPRRT
jgi:hypothetical protein